MKTVAYMRVSTDTQDVTHQRLAILEFAVPTGWPFRSVYMAYFSFVLPRLGRLFSGHTAAYEYLPASVGAFAAPDEFVALLRGTGFADVAARPLTFGAVVLYTACKAAENQSRRLWRPAAEADILRK